MGNVKSADEARMEDIKQMGEELGNVYHELWQEVAWLHSKWGEYEELFAKKESRIDLLNNAAPFFFRVVQDALWENVLLHLAKLTDPPKKGKNKNLTLKMLPEMVNGDLKIELVTLKNKLDNATSFCRDWRNKHIAHIDLHLALKTGAKPLKPVKYVMVREALKATVDMLNAVSKYYQDSENDFSLSSFQGGESLLYVIDEGLRSREERERRIEKGENTEEDFAERDI